jgi:hypothetical protein
MSVKRIGATTAAVLAGLASLTSVIAWLQSQVKSKPVPPISSAITAARLSSEHEPLGDYWRSIHKPMSMLTKEEQAEEGLLFAVKVKLRGAPGSARLLYWSMHKASGARLKGPAYNPKGPAAKFTPESRAHAGGGPVWTPYPPRRGSYYVRFTLFDANRKPVDERKTPVFHLSSVPRL